MVEGVGYTSRGGRVMLISGFGYLSDMEGARSSKIFASIESIAILIIPSSVETLFILELWLSVVSASGTLHESLGWTLFVFYFLNNAQILVFCPKLFQQFRIQLFLNLHILVVIVTDIFFHVCFESSCIPKVEIAFVCVHFVRFQQKPT